MPSPTKKRLLYASPFSPMASGISDYSEVMVYGLKKYFDITLLIDDYRLSNKRLYKDFDVKVYKSKKKPSIKSFDFKIYNIGNNPQYHSYIYDAALSHPGLVILHDFALYFLTIGYYENKGLLYSKIFELAGAWGLHLIKKNIRSGKNLLECKQLASSLPLNAEILKSRNKIMVHSEYAYQKVSEIVKEPDRIKKIEHIALSKNNAFVDKELLYKKYDIPISAIVVGSFGYIAPTKLNHAICQTVTLLNEKFDNRLVYLMVGEGSSVDEYLGIHIRKTGYVNLNEFQSFLKYVDVVVNLRYPTMGETSGAIIQALGLGKPCIVSDDAWFSELPDDVAIKVKNENMDEELYENLLRLLDDPQRMKNLSYKAQQFIQKNHSLNKISAKIADFLRW